MKTRCFLFDERNENWFFMTTIHISTFMSMCNPVFESPKIAFWKGVIGRLVMRKLVTISFFKLWIRQGPKHCSRVYNIIYLCYIV